MLRRRVRKSFLFAAIGYLALGAFGLSFSNYADYGESALTHYGIVAFYLAQGLLYATAWYTTRTPSPYRNNWAVAASVLSLLWAGLRLWHHHTDVMAMRFPLIGLIIALSGIYVFIQGGSPARPEVASGTPEPTPARKVKPQRAPARPLSTTPTATAPSLAAISGDVTYDGPWDPLAAVRTSETLRKLKAS